MNYRQKYEKYTKRSIPDGWDVHHIDGDRKNNYITNLVAIPKNIHEDFHRIEYTYRSIKIPDYSKFIGNVALLNPSIDDDLETVIAFKEICEYITIFVMIRNVLIGASNIIGPERDRFYKYLDITEEKWA